MNKINLLQSFSPIILLILLLSVNVLEFGNDSISGPNQIALLFSAALACLIALKRNISWEEIFKSISNSIKSTSNAMIILLLIGALSGSWLIGGIIPTLVYYGLELLNVNYFLIATCIITAIVSLSIGSSWSTIATIGIALLAIGKVLGVPAEITAGAIISGSYFGDKMSPLSDTTNLASAVTESDIFEHIKYMSYTTIPSFVITLVIFFIIGLNYENSSFEDLSNIQKTLDKTFNINPLILLTPLLVIFLIIKKIPAVASLFFAVLLGCLSTFIFQEELLETLVKTDSYFNKSEYYLIISSITTNFSIITENNSLNSLLSTSGMSGMLNTIWLVISAMVFGGSMHCAGIIKDISEFIRGNRNNDKNIVFKTVISCIFFNVTTADQYLSIIVNGKIFKKNYSENKLSSLNLSRTLEDSGTVTSVLVPWNTCGATQSAILGVSTIAYLPFCFFNLISPIMTLILAYSSFRVKKIIITK
ncbi:Na+/H+ antiporter NhaC [Bacteroidota bacterium]|nr:Na+/H+ antiporter NhaC [Bacteroidota bacterium]MDC3230303.1 Na+/H+ antiporter NhaC [Bacteroidota bacterium]